MSVAAVAAVAIDPAEVEFTAVRSQGAGGQNVNKVSSAAELRVELADLEQVMPLDAIARLRSTAGSRLTNENELLFFADDSRTQEQNRADAIRRLRELIIQAMVRPKPRKKTKPGRAAKQRRLNAKKHRGDIKAGRGFRGD